VELKTYYRWLLENTLPLNRIAQFEALTGSRFISEYLSVLHGDRVVIEIPRGRKGKTADMAQVQSQTAAALALLAKMPLKTWNVILRRTVVMCCGAERRRVVIFKAAIILR
jgi:hypothetical protein